MIEKSPILMGKSQFLMGKSQFLMGKSLRCDVCTHLYPKKFSGNAGATIVDAPWMAVATWNAKRRTCDGAKSIKPGGFPPIFWG